MKKFKKIFIAGANGMLGTTLKSLTDTSEMLLTDKELSDGIKFCDIRDLKHTAEVINNFQPDIILNFAALVDLEYCEKEKDDCYLTNTIAAIHLFNLAKDQNIPYVFISTAGIFVNDKPKMEPSAPNVGVVDDIPKRYWTPCPIYEPIPVAILLHILCIWSFIYILI